MLKSQLTRARFFLPVIQSFFAKKSLLSMPLKLNIFFKASIDIIETGQGPSTKTRAPIELKI